MAGGIEIRLDGIEKLQKRLDALPGKIQRRAIRKPLRATATKIARRLAAGTPRGDPKPLNAYQRVKIIVRSTDKEAWAKVRYKGRTGQLMRFYERGVNSRRHHQPARPFFVQAVGNWQEQAKAAFAESLRAAVEREEDAGA